jgi:hypothetical protein
VDGTIKGSFSAAYGKYTYDSNPNLSVNNDALATVENTNPSFDFGKALLKNYKQAGMPQQAYALGIEYRDPKYWWIGTNIKFWQKPMMCLPISRTNSFYTVLLAVPIP